MSKKMFFCGKNIDRALKHVRETHKEEIICEVCQKTFKHKDYLKQYMKTHAPERDAMSKGRPWQNLQNCVQSPEPYSLSRRKDIHLCVNILAVAKCLQ